MNSLNGSPQQSVDYLIAGALHAQVAGAEPSHDVWKRTRHRAMRWAIKTQPYAAGWNAILSPMPLALGRSGSTTLRCELSMLRFWDYAAMLFRFGW